MAPQFFGFDGGALSITGTAFNNNGALLTNLYWTQHGTDGSWTIQVGQIDVPDFVDVSGLVSPYSAFQNLAFNTNPTINAPNPGLGIAAGAKLGSNFYTVASLADANADPASPDLDVFSDGNLFKSLEIGYTGGFDRLYFDKIHLTLWHSDATSDGSRAEGYGTYSRPPGLLKTNGCPSCVQVRAKERLRSTSGRYLQAPDIMRATRIWPGSV